MTRRRSPSTNCKLSERTATGEAIFTSLQSIDTLSAVLGGSDQAPPARIVLLSDGKQTVPENSDDPRGGFTAARVRPRTREFRSRRFRSARATGESRSKETDIPVPVDDPSLKEIANLSGGSFFTASSLEELRDVYDTLEEQIGFETTRGDASRPWLILGVVFATAGLTVALVRGSDLP